MSHAKSAEQDETPADIQPTGWWQVAKRGWRGGKADNVGMLAGGVTFFGFLALFPALIAALMVYGLVADPRQVANQVESITSGLPESARSLITDQLTTATGAGNSALTFGLVVALAVALWSAASGVRHLMTAVNIAYDERESRGFVRLQAIALGLTLAAIVFVLVTLALVAVVPPLVEAMGLGVVGQVVAEVVRWLLLIGLVLVAFAVIYRVAPDRPDPRWVWVSPGAVLGTLLWLLASVGFSLYVNYFGNYAATYGAIAGVVVLMLWLYLTSYVVLLGAEINAESERQVAKRP